jgi:hypothetical protein
VLLALIVSTLSCGEAGVSGSLPVAERGQWEKLTESPLAARRSAHAFSVDEKLLVMGGTAAQPCPAGAG